MESHRCAKNQPCHDDGDGDDARPKQQVASKGSPINGGGGEEDESIGFPYSSLSISSSL